MTVTNNELAILVVLYGCELDESRTLHSLVELSHQLNGAKLVVWNNGPKYLNENVVSSFESKLDFELIQTIENISLAKIYNNFIVLNDSEKYVILDHDTNVNIYYLKSLKVFEGNIAAPKIYSRSVLHSPRFSKLPLSSKREVTAIGSGLIISKSAVTCISKCFGSVFDERFLLYGVDTTLFYRLAKCYDLEKELFFLPELEHSLSSNETETNAVNQFRLKEKSYDFGLRLRFYPSYDKFILLFILIAKSILKNSPLKVSYIFSAIFTGKHYRK
ncbi:hypothetical protein [Vibrio alginolyticus]|uniref:hypothetical protein n=1 Tax=Vibrio alginolyticus TaxID=663 RepID=UPI001303705D|nr:hypothetical protein [Vibrio alginolyticus]ELP9499537.1 hypothetical protein [Vibrio alginolyticus]